MNRVGFNTCGGRAILVNGVASGKVATGKVAIMATLPGRSPVSIIIIILMLSLIITLIKLK